jgi:hypothetical protein
LNPCCIFKAPVESLLGGACWNPAEVPAALYKVRDAVVAFLAAMGSPFRASKIFPSCLEADRAAVCAWLAGLEPIAQRVGVNEDEDEDW